MKRFLVIPAIIAATIPSLASADTTLLPPQSGFAINNSSYEDLGPGGGITTTQTEDLTAVATFDGKAGGDYRVTLSNGDNSVSCQGAVSGRASSASCTIPSAPPGDWSVKFHIAKGKIYATVTITTP